MIGGLEVASREAGGPGGGGAGTVRFTPSAEASVDLDVLSPTGRVVEMVTHGRAGAAGLNQVSWRGALGPGVYLLRATATTEDGTSVQAVRPVVVTRCGVMG